MTNKYQYNFLYVEYKLGQIVIIMVICILILLFLSANTLSSCSQSKETDYRLVGGPCEGCEAVLEYSEQELTPVDTLPGFNKEGQKIKISGTVYERDGKTPAEGVILYLYHTNQEGIYEAGDNAKGWAEKHGYIREWLKTDEDGQYTFYTLKPAAYPSRSEPAHIHIIVLEPDGQYYWISGYHFAGDSLLTEKETNPKNPRGGTSGLIDLQKEGALWVGQRDIVLGKNIQGYQQ
jgi:protocatechuate 3,4-dioxygenase beta subunit